MKFGSKFKTFAFITFLLLVILYCCFSNNSNIIEGLSLCGSFTTSKGCYSTDAGGRCKWDIYRKKCETKSCNDYMNKAGKREDGYCPEDTCFVDTRKEKVGKVPRCRDNKWKG